MEQPTWDKLARKVIELLEEEDDTNSLQTHYSYAFHTKESVHALAMALEKANKSFMWTPVQEVKSAGRRSD